MTDIEISNKEINAKMRPYQDSLGTSLKYLKKVSGQIGRHIGSRAIPYDAINDSILEHLIDDLVDTYKVVKRQKARIEEVAEQLGTNARNGQ